MIKFLEDSVSTPFKVMVVLLVVTTIGILSFKTGSDAVDTSVTITDRSQRHGGSGLVLTSSTLKSIILTNSHVCKVIEKGGLVNHQGRSHRAATFKHSKVHDLCLIEVNDNLGVSTTVASSAPSIFSEDALIVGHPHLLPTVVTRGHFSEKRIIQVLSEIRKCSDAEFGANPLLCLVLGGFPIIREFESTLVSATIMPGSSGSGVFNSSNELVGLAFAGSKDLSYAWTVPFEYLRFFLDFESKVLEFTPTSSTIDLSSALRDPNDGIFPIAKKNCLNIKFESLNNVCDLLLQDLVWRAE